MTFLGKYNSRKFWITTISLVLFVLLPMMYEQTGVTEKVQLLVISCVAFAMGIYNGANVLEKKYRK